MIKLRRVCFVFCVVCVVIKNTSAMQGSLTAELKQGGSSQIAAIAKAIYAAQFTEDLEVFKELFCSLNDFFYMFPGVFIDSMMKCAAATNSTLQQDIFTQQIFSQSEPWKLLIKGKVSVQPSNIQESLTKISLTKRDYFLYLLDLSCKTLDKHSKTFLFQKLIEVAAAAFFEPIKNDSTEWSDQKLFKQELRLAFVNMLLYSYSRCAACPKDLLLAPLVQFDDKNLSGGKGDFVKKYRLLVSAFLPIL